MVRKLRRYCTSKERSMRALDKNPKRVVHARYVLRRERRCLALNDDTDAQLSI